MKHSKRFFLVKYEEEGTTEVLKKEELGEGKLEEGETIVVIKYKENYVAKIIKIGEYY